MKKYPVAGLLKLCSFQSIRAVLFKDSIAAFAGRQVHKTKNNAFSAVVNSLKCLFVLSLFIFTPLHSQAQLGGGGDSEQGLSAAFEPPNFSAELGSGIGEGGAGLLGDSVSLADGTLSFSHTDVSVPGNSGLPVAFSRFYTVDGVSYHPYMGLGGWNIDVPFITARVTEQFGWTNTRCSGNPKPHISNDPELNDRAWSGVKIFTQGAGGQLLFHNPQGGSNVFGNAIPKKTTENHWRIDCTNSVTGGSGEGFIATTTNGMKYTFDYLNISDGKDLPVATGGCGDQLCEIDPDASIPTDHWNFYATEISDVHGNWVRYDYSNGKLTRIHANDGREITIEYEGGGISEVKTNGRKWLYSYTGGSLSRVTRPDDLYWEFELQPQKAFQKGYFCTDYPLSTGAQSSYARTSTVRHPNGTLGSFELGLIKNGRNNVPDLSLIHI